MKKIKKAATNTSSKTTQSKRGTGKSPTVEVTHRKKGAILSSKKAKSPLDNRGPKHPKEPRTHRVMPY